MKLFENSIFIICPTRERVERCTKMIKSIRETATGKWFLTLIVDIDDPQVKKYEKLVAPNIMVLHSMDDFITTKINNVFRQFNNFPFYHVTNDDFVYRTKGWDETLKNKNKISYGNDLFSNLFPTTSVIDGDICRALGWLQMPSLKHLYGDSVWNVIGHHLNILKYKKEVVIEHEHYMNQKAKKDHIYEKTNSKEMYKHDDLAFRTWVSENMQSDCQQIRDALLCDTR